MGYVNLPGLDDYWSTNKLFWNFYAMPFMTRHKFQNIRSMLQLNTAGGKAGNRVDRWLEGLATRCLEEADHVYTGPTQDKATYKRS